MWRARRTRTYGTPHFEPSNSTASTSSGARPIVRASRTTAVALAGNSSARTHTAPPANAQRCAPCDFSPARLSPSTSAGEPMSGERQPKLHDRLKMRDLILVGEVNAHELTRGAVGCSHIL